MIGIVETKVEGRGVGSTRRFIATKDGTLLKQAAVCGARREMGRNNAKARKI